MKGASTLVNHSLGKKSVAEPENTGVQETIGQHLVYYAAERTLMSWIRTALGLMALGFVIDRFGLILRESMQEASVRFYPRLFSFWTGTALVILGTLMALTAAVRYWRFSTAYDRIHTTHPRHGILIGVLYALILVVIGVIITSYLLMATD
jgi:putative membrane protein